MIVFVGYPASGKSSFYRKYLELRGYDYINRDTLGSWQKCISVCNDILKAGRHVAIDNTNPDKESRKRYIDLAKKYSIPVRCFQFMTSLEHSKHNNRFRELILGEKLKTVINDVAFNYYKARFEQPTLDEGFSEIVQIQFIPHFIDTSNRTLYHMFLV